MNLHDESPAGIARAIAEAWLSGPWTLEGLRSRLMRLTGRSRLPISLESMVLGFFLELRDDPTGRRLAPLAQAIGHHAGFRRMRSRLQIEARIVEPPEMAASPRDWGLPGIPTDSALAAWLGVNAEELSWLTRGTRHYRPHWRAQRLIEAPRARLAAVQRRILSGLISRVPPHPACHGFRRHHSVLTAVEMHVGQPLLVVHDLQAFFPSVRASRIHALLQRAGYPEPVARTLTRLCTTRCLRMPASQRPIPWAVRSRYADRHLPQGAPTSPALANLTAYRLDARLLGLAETCGARYSRYADDLIFSGPRRLAAPRFTALLTRIVREEGFALNPTKSRSMGAGTRQQVLGVVVNGLPSLPRKEFERLEAILFNCGRGQQPAGVGWQTNLRAHLAGRVAWARQLNPHRARRLQALYAAIDWQSLPINPSQR